MSIDNSLFTAFAVVIVCCLVLVGFILLIICNLVIGVLMLPLMAFLIAITEDMHLSRFEKRTSTFSARFDRAWGVACNKLPTP